MRSVAVVDSIYACLLEDDVGLCDRHRNPAIPSTQASLQHHLAATGGSFKRPPNFKPALDKGPLSVGINSYNSRLLKRREVDLVSILDELVERLYGATACHRLVAEQSQKQDDE